MYVGPASLWLRPPPLRADRPPPPATSRSPATFPRPPPPPRPRPFLPAADLCGTAALIVGAVKGTLAPALAVGYSVATLGWVSFAAFFCT